MNTSYFSQGFAAVRCEWGAHGIATLGPDSDILVIVDVLSFSTCVDVAVGNGAFVYPYPRHDQSAERFAADHQALLAHTRQSDSTGYSLSPASLRAIPAGTRLVLPSPNGSTLSQATGTIPTIAGCLRNARAVAHMAQTKRWCPDLTRRRVPASDVIATQYRCSEARLIACGNGEVLDHA